MIITKNIVKKYEQLTVLKDVSLEIKQGELVSIIGKSGAGKSTLLHIMGTLDNATSGEVWIDGVAVQNLDNRSISKFRNENIGFIFQFHHLLPEFTAFENVMLPSMVNNKNKMAAEKRAKELLDYLGLSERMTHKPNQLSGGEAQRVAVARALINEPKVIFADEPTGNLDSNTSNDLHQLFLRLKKDFNQTLVIVTHNAELAKLSDRTIQMADGQIVND